ncbi:pyridoxal phosphate-dependent aminotransferase [Bartonella sp. DGB2]|uniref:pyridoxal phosphate-dependent aminotransferase n=1 Tax=Bartonella sp. DGB2 TaxID=3388426 RepID=UPI00398FA0A2
MNYPQPKKGILDIKAYVPGASLANGKPAHKMSSNESCLGPSPLALQAFQDALHNLNRYPNGNLAPLIPALTKATGLDREQLLIGNGSEEILALLAITYLERGDCAIMSKYGFETYKIQTIAAGATPILIDEHDFRVDIEAIIASVHANPHCKVVFIANPGNPTGTYLIHEEIKHLQANIPPHVLLVLDSAYAEFVEDEAYHAGEDLVSQTQNVVMIRTFSKAYGMAGLRVGWLYGPRHLVAAVNQIRCPFNVGVAAQAAAAAALEDQKFLQESVAYHQHWRQFLARALTNMGLSVTPSTTNFLLVHFPDDPLYNAQKADTFLKNNGYIARPVHDYSLPNALRISVGKPEENEEIIAILRKFLP